MSEKPWVGAESYWGGTTCLYADRPGSSACDKPALHHLLTDTVNPDGSAATLPACDDHFAIASRLAIDSHDYSGLCGMPDTLWIVGTQDEPGRCIWPAAEEANAALAGVMAGSGATR